MFKQERISRFCCKLIENEKMFCIPLRWILTEGFKKSFIKIRLSLNNLF